MMEYRKEEILLKAEKINLFFGEKQVLRDIDLCIKNIVRPGVTQGQVVSLLGRSGIGKTQLFRILSGLQKPTSGTVTGIDNKPIMQGDMGVVFQNYYLFEWRTIRQSLELAAKKNPQLKPTDIKDQIDQQAQLFNLTEHLNKYPQQLSGGQRQRASIIQQLLNGSNFLLLDEPFSGLDVIMLEKVVELLLKVSLSDELKTLILVSHDIETSVALADTTFILAQEDGKPGATIIKEVDLCERELAWEKDVKNKKEFANTVQEIKALL
ncbi:ABC transporter ATP-binding protein [Pinibacter soli]|uniref:ATP-binding cassette domain-containing protein n=1 Tax=Pinibacter soli TaxID=3044211 RepID=A0ABT6R7M5_9BACT|nr:ATP-binding cassette domain-containing protein [Pinibacter soli]MDI3318390.1 ATP-binding cassette domain-containing protein [Pinibacter soli]